MPKKIRELVRELLRAGFVEIKGSGKGSHRKFKHDRFKGMVTLSGSEGNDAKKYQEKQVRSAIEKTAE